MWRKGGSVSNRHTSRSARFGRGARAVGLARPSAPVITRLRSSVGIGHPTIDGRHRVSLARSAHAVTNHKIRARLELILGPIEVVRAGMFGRAEEATIGLTSERHLME